DFPRGFGADEQVAGLVEGERGRVRRLRPVERRALAVRRDLVDDALVARTGVQVSPGIDGERPDVFVFGVEKLGFRSVSIDLVDLSVGRRRDVQSAVWRGRERVRFELGAVEKYRTLAVGVDAEHFPFVAGADEERAVGAG